MTPLRTALSIILLATSTLAQRVAPDPTPEEIMARVAANQDRSEIDRARYVYVQHARVRSSKGKTLMCEEITDSRIVPTADGSSIELLTLNGKQWVKDHYFPYTDLKAKAHREDKNGKDGNWDEDMDRDLVSNMRKNLTQDKSKDGLAARLFPLTSKNQEDYQYRLIGREKQNERDVFHIRFAPKDKDKYTWKGDAWIDAQEFQPVVISTTMARKVPFVARTLLGTNLPGLGFTVTYAPQADGVWFPVSFGSEFGLRVLFFIHCSIIIDAQNRDFEKTHVNSHVVEGAAAASQE